MIESIVSQEALGRIYTLPGYSGDSLTTYPHANKSILLQQPSNGTNDQFLGDLTQNLINSFILIVCLSGLVGNGVVIWLLGFQIKRNPFTTYILNLSVADFGVLISLISAAACVTVNSPRINIFSRLLFTIFLELFFCTYSTSQFLLVAISLDRCVAALFPLWHRCHRPPHLSIIICTLVWILCFLLAGIHFTLLMTGISEGSPLFFQLIVNVLLGAPLMLISTLILFIQAYCKAKQSQRGKFVTAILLALLFFLIFAFPLNLLYIIYSYYVSFPNLIFVGFVCASLNSSINPLIYFLVGKRQRQSHARVSIKVALQRVFEDEPDSKGVENTPRETLE
ncbi:mas-related G-protein coupled receptor member H-like [Pogona vitticeps]